MKPETKRKIARLAFLLEQRDVVSKDVVCACRRPLTPFLSAAMRKALDDVIAAVADEPEPGRGAYLEVDK